MLCNTTPAWLLLTFATVALKVICAGPVVTTASPKTHVSVTGVLLSLGVLAVGTGAGEMLTLTTASPL